MHDQPDFQFDERPDMGYFGPPAPSRPPTKTATKRPPKTTAFPRTYKPKLEPETCRPHFDTVAELDAWMESCKNPNIDHHPVTVTEAEWEWHKRHR